MQTPLELHLHMTSVISGRQGSKGGKHAPASWSSMKLVHNDVEVVSDQAPLLKRTSRQLQKYGNSHPNMKASLIRWSDRHAPGPWQCSGLGVGLHIYRRPPQTALHQ